MLCVTYPIIEQLSFSVVLDITDLFNLNKRFSNISAISYTHASTNSSILIEKNYL